jgi:hypothetical protein
LSGLAVARDYRWVNGLLPNSTVSVGAPHFMRFGCVDGIPSN